MMVTKAEYIATMKQQLDEFDTVIREYERKVDLARDDAQTIHSESLFKLRQQWMLMRDKLELEATSEENSWNQFRLEADHLHEVLAESFNTLKARL